MAYRRAQIATDIDTLSTTVGDNPPVFPRPRPSARRRGYGPRLARRHTAYRQRLDTTVTALMNGDTPDGFGSVAAEATSNTLWGKRFFEAAIAEPTLREIPDARQRFTDYARTHPHRTSAVDDAHQFHADSTQADGEMHR